VQKLADHSNGYFSVLLFKLPCGTFSNKGQFEEVKSHKMGSVPYMARAQEERKCVEHEMQLAAL
jgi:hypothetical protein